MSITHEDKYTYKRRINYTRAGNNPSPDSMNEFAMSSKVKSQSMDNSDHSLIAKYCIGKNENTQTSVDEPKLNFRRKACIRLFRR